MKENNNNTNKQFNSKELNTNNKAESGLSEKISCCRSFLSSKVCIAIIFALLGFSGAILANNIVDKANNGKFQSVIRDPFFADHDVVTLKSSSSFYYSFVMPEYNTKIEPEIVKQYDKITVKLVKNSTQKPTEKASDSKK